MKLKFVVLFSTGIIFFIRLFWKDSIGIFNENTHSLFGIYINKMSVYLYQALVILSVYYIKKINSIILFILLLINIILITFYCIKLS